MNCISYELTCRTVSQLFPPIHTTFESVVIVTTLHQPFDPDSMWVVHPPSQLFFKCTLRPINATKGRYNRYSEDIDVDLVFFSAFEDLRHHTSGTMETNEIRKLY